MPCPRPEIDRSRTDDEHEAALALAQIQAELARFAPGAPLRVEVSRLSLFAYASAQIGGRLTRVADFDFATTPPALLTQQTGILPFSWP